jgi:hypothetical protein
LTKKINYSKTGKKAEEFKLDMEVIEKELHAEDDDEEHKLLKKIEQAEKEKRARIHLINRSTKSKSS